VGQSFSPSSADAVAAGGVVKVDVAGGALNCTDTDTRIGIGYGYVYRIRQLPKNPIRGYV
jgi:hypothetical protein